MKTLRRYQRQFILLLVLGIIIGLIWHRTPEFLDVRNLLDLTRHLAEVGIIACGMTLIIMTGGIDLSVGSLLALCGIVFGYTWQYTEKLGDSALLIAAAAALTCGLLGGAVNGKLVSRWGLPPLIVTLGTMALYRGVAMVISKARPVSGFNDTFLEFGEKEVAGVPLQLWIWLAMVVVFAFVVARTRVGRYVMAIGDNELAARYAALPVDRLKFWLYVATGALCALASIILTARVSTARADAATGLELEVITAVVLGGTAITGGRGTVSGTFLGVLVLGMMRQGLNLAGIASIWQTIIAGALLITTAIANQLAIERASRRKVALPEPLPAAA